jgi:hypothetical protein
MRVCGACGVGFIGAHGDAHLLTEVLRVHEIICPGGERAGELVTPFDCE